MVCQAQSTCADELKGLCRATAHQSAAATAHTAGNCTHRTPSPGGQHTAGLREGQEQPAAMGCMKPGHNAAFQARENLTALSYWQGNCSGAVP